MPDGFAINLNDLEDLDVSSRMPLYAQLADMLGARIRASQAELAGLPLPSEIDTACYLKISRPTVRQAMNQLLSEGLIVRSRGQGTFVAPPHASRDIGQVVGFDVLAPNYKVEFRLLERKRVTPPPYVSKLFKLKGREQVEQIKRLRLADGQIFAYEERFMPIRFALKVGDARWKQEAGVDVAKYILQSKHGHVEFRVRATAADTRIARLLNVKKGSPLLASEHTYFAPNGEAMLHGTVLFRGDRYDFCFQAPVRSHRK